MAIIKERVFKSIVMELTNKLWTSWPQIEVWHCLKRFRALEKSLVTCANLPSDETEDCVGRKFVLKIMRNICSFFTVNFLTGHSCCSADTLPGHVP